MQTPTTQEYFTALQEILRLQTHVLTNVLPHPGERGSNDEEHFKAFLRRSLPHRYSIGTGFMISSNPSVPASRQTDIVIFDEFENSPIFRELAATVFPIEIVYAAIEVKRVLQSKDLEASAEAIARIRRLGKEKRYVDYSSFAVEGDENKKIVKVVPRPSMNAPRTFVVAYDTEYATVESLADAWATVLHNNRDAHLHGCAVLSKDWYIVQFAFQQKANMLPYADNALVRLLSSVLTGVSSLSPLPLTDMDRYFHLDDHLSPLVTDRDE